jgi:hypothetical protein
MEDFVSLWGALTKSTLVLFLTKFGGTAYQDRSGIIKRKFLLFLYNQYQQVSKYLFALDLFVLRFDQHYLNT